MEIPNSKQQQLTFDKGITNVPSDAICSDNTLEECVGLTYGDGEFTVIQKPKHVGTIAGKLAYIHQDRWLYLKEEVGATYLYYGDERIISVDADVRIASVGKTVVLMDSNGLRYLLWDGTRYKTTEGSLPDIGITFSLTEAAEKPIEHYSELFYADLNYMLQTYNVPFSVNAGNTAEPVYLEMHQHYYTNDRVGDAQNAIIGLVAQRLKLIKEDKEFAFPFWVRYAVRLYDTSYTYISAPFLMMPTVRHNCNVFICHSGDVLDPLNGKIQNTLEQGNHFVNYKPKSYDLKFQLDIPTGVNLDEWEDIIAGIDVFVSKDVRGFDIDGKWEIINPYMVEDTRQTENKHNKPLSDGCDPSYWTELMKESLPSGRPRDDYFTQEAAHRFGCYFDPVHYSDKEIADELLDSSTFYKLFELSFNDIRQAQSAATPKNAKDYIRKNVLLNIESQDQLQHDDYFSRTKMVAQVVKAFNSRLHLGDVRRGFFDGFKNFSYSAYAPHATTVPSYNRDIYVYIKSDSGERIVKQTATASREIIDTWFFYPDTRAYKVEFYQKDTDNLLLSLPLTEHPRLNGAYYIKLPDATSVPEDIKEVKTVIVNNEPEKLENHMVVSEVNNPYVFYAEGYYRVGMGRVLGIATQTTALGQEEHGKHPLTVFTTKGIYGMLVNDTGIYMRPDELSREVCNSPSTITETDGAVFFSSEKGLMVIVGSTVKCVSEQLSGTTNGLNIGEIAFQKYLKDAFIAYDYRDSLLWIFNIHTGFEEYCYVYSIKTGTFAKYVFDSVVTNAINDYPDYLLQSGNDVYSLLKRSNINSSEERDNSYAGRMITRPMKLENAFALKKLIQVMNVKQIEGTLSLRIFASNNISRETGSWLELYSLLGMPWKYYKFQYDFTNLKATDRFAGSVVVTQEVRTNKLR